MRNHKTFKEVNLQLIRRNNQETVLTLLRAKSPLSVSDVSFISRLSLSTVKTVIADLKDLNLVVSQGIGKSTGGRKPEIYTLDSKQNIIAGLSFGSSRLRCSLYTIKKECIDELQTEMSDVSVDQIIATTKSSIISLLEKNHIPSTSLIAAGLTQSGLVDENGKTIISSLHHSWKSIPIGEMLQEELNIPFIVMEDARAYLASEDEISGIGEYNDRIYFLMGPHSGEWGIGSGIVANGSVVTGKNGIAGEVGHISIDLNGKKCCCGRQGCWEIEADPYDYFKEYIDEYESDNDTKSVFAFIHRKLESGDVGLDIRVREYANMNASAISNIIHIFNPDKVIIGGEIADIGPMFFDKLVKDIERICMPQFYHEDIIEISCSNENRSILGAIVCVIDRLIDIKSNVSYWS